MLLLSFCLCGGRFCMNMREFFRQAWGKQRFLTGSLDDSTSKKFIATYKLVHTLQYNDILFPFFFAKTNNSLPSY